MKGTTTSIGPIPLIYYILIGLAAAILFVWVGVHTLNALTPVTVAVGP